MLLYVFVVILFLFHGKFAHLYSILKSHFHYYHLINKNLKKRDNFQAKSYFKKNSIDFEIIKNAVLAAGTAPNGANLQPWHFVIANTEEGKKRIAKGTEGFYSFNTKKILELVVSAI